MELHISIIPETIAHWGNIPITNTLLTSVMVTFFLIIAGWVIGKRARFMPGKVQNAIETLFEGFLGFVEDTLGDRKVARTIFPLLMTIFLFILISNLVEFLPGIGSIGLHGECHKPVCEPLFRSVNTDLNVTLALGLVAFLAIEAAGIKYLGFFSYAKKFINFGSPLKFYVGLVELISEMARIVSFSFRLFGNIFAGEVIIGVAAAVLPVALPVPFMIFEVLVGLVQAAIFAVLILFFVKSAIIPVEH